MIELKVLGSLGLHDAGGRELSAVIVRQKQLALLAYLALAEPRGWRQRNELLALFWPESDEKRARFSLRSALHGLRKDLGDDVVLARGDDEVAVNREALRCDAALFEEHVAGGRLSDAMLLYEGPLLNGVVVPGLSDFQLWVDARREALRRTAVQAATSLAKAAESAGDLDAALRWSRELERLAPHDEAALRLQLSLLQRAGDRVTAGRIYDAWTARLHADLDVEPSAETRELMARIRRGEGAAVSTAPPPAATYTNVVDAPATPPAPPTLAPTPARSHRTIIRTIIAAAALALVAVASLLTVALRAGARATATVVPLGTVVLPFQYAGDGESSYMGSALSLLVSTSLGTTGPFGSVDPRAVAGAIAHASGGSGSDDLRLGSDVGRRLGARYFIAGTVVTAHRAMRVEAGLYEVGGGSEPVVRAVAEGETDSVFAVADRLSRELLSERIGAESPDALGTTSVAALRAYVDGERALLGSRYAEATIAFRRAVAADSLFARGWFRLGYAAGWSAGGDTAIHALDHAVLLSGRLRPDDRLLLLAWRAFLIGDKARAVDLYEHFLNAQPRSVEAWLQLAELRFHWGPMLGVAPASARDAFARVASLAPDQATALVHLARLEARETPGAPALDSLARAALALGVEPGEALEMRALLAVAHRDTAARRAVIDAAAADPASAELLVRLLVSGPADRAFVDAIARTQLGAPSSAQRVWAAVQLVQVAATRGRFHDAEALADSLATTNPGRALELRAWLALLPLRPPNPEALHRLRAKLASFDATLPARRQMKGLADPGIYAPRRVYLQGALALADGDSTFASNTARALERGTWRDSLDGEFAKQYARTLRMELALRAGPAAARRFADSLPPTEVEVGNTFPDLMSFVNARSRYLRAELLEVAGRADDARKWWATFPDPSGYDSWFLAGALTRRARLETAAGARAEAASDERRLAKLGREGQ